MSDNTLYWHDYETSGIDARRDRPLQFAGIRTDEVLNEIGKSLDIYCKPADDLLPNPDACLVTGLAPQDLMAKGLTEAGFIRLVHAELARAGTCGCGYNTLRFDDEFTRNTLYRNFYDPYAREWQNGNSRWDIIDMVRATRALRPEGIEWPNREDGSPSFKLEALTRANGIAHEAAHDALSDVRATIAVARLIREKQPRLYDYLYRLRSKRLAAEQINPREMKPVLHTSGMISGEFCCTTLVAPLATHPTNKNGIIVYDLRHDPAPLIELDADTIRERLFTSLAEQGEGAERIPLKTVHLNKCPVLVTPKTLTSGAEARMQLDVGQCLRHLERLKAAHGLAQKIGEIFGANRFEPETDPDLALYGGSFFGDKDRARMEVIRGTPPVELGTLALPFDDPRIPEMLFRYRARNYPETLGAEEQARWREYRRQRLANPDGGGSITLDQYFRRIAELGAEAETGETRRALLQRLRDYGDTLQASL
jgi:exodeoxyribonuclease-1